jgi:uncharacterized membrane protein
MCIDLLLYVRVKEVKAEKERLHAELERKLNPKTKLDFAMLFNELDEWRQQEVAKIKVGAYVNSLLSFREFISYLSLLCV